MEARSEKSITMIGRKVDHVTAGGCNAIIHGDDKVRNVGVVRMFIIKHEP
jgi:hypothetical protein